MISTTKIGDCQNRSNHQKELANGPTSHLDVDLYNYYLAKIASLEMW